MRGIRLQADDDVAITTADVAAGTPVDVGGGLVTVRPGRVRGGTSWPCGTLRPGRRCAGTGRSSGSPRGPVAAGEHIHLHNLEYREFERAYEFAVTGRSRRADVLAEADQDTFAGYVRADGSVGTRNFLGILTTVNCSATAARQIANRMRYSGILDDFEHVDGVVALTHGLGCGMDPSRGGHRGAAPGHARLPDPPELRRFPAPRPGL